MQPTEHAGDQQGDPAACACGLPTAQGSALGGAHCPGQTSAPIGKDVDDDLNQVLNLNTEQLRRNRQRAFDAAVAILKRELGEHGTWRPERLVKALEDLRAQQPLQPYVGVLEHYLERKIGSVSEREQARLGCGRR